MCDTYSDSTSSYDYAYSGVDTATISTENRSWRLYLYTESKSFLGGFCHTVNYHYKSNQHWLWSQLHIQPKADRFRKHYRYGHHPFLKYGNGFV